MSYSEPSSGPLGLGLWSKFKSFFHLGHREAEYSGQPTPEMMQTTAVPSGNYRLQPMPQESAPAGTGYYHSSPRVIQSSQPMMQQGGAATQINAAPNAYPQGKVNVEPPQSPPASSAQPF
jgi:hypothetical protein